MSFKETLINIGDLHLKDPAKVSKDIEEHLSHEDKGLVEEIGYVYAISDGIVIVRGLYNAFLDEVIRFESGVKGVVKALKEYEVQIVLFDNYDQVSGGMKAYRTNSSLQIPVGKGIIGRVMDAFGEPIDGLGSIEREGFATYDTTPPSLIEREQISEQLITGIIAIDTSIQIGLGQRELILGDINTGKTSIAIGTIINQLSRFKNGNPIYCVYVSIGQKGEDLIHVHKRLADAGAMDYTAIIAATASDSAHAQFIAPYSACTMAEFLMRKGNDVLIVYDDLSNHANAHREMCRLIRFPSGREAYPADIFAMHAKLLERAAKLSEEAGGGSITALPIIKTEAGDYSKYIPTNIISITDGQILLKSDLAYKRMPPIDIGLSVSRIGSAVQCSAMKEVSKGLRILLSRYKGLSDFEAVAGSDSFDNSQKELLAQGEQLSLLMSQYVDELYSMEEQVILMTGIKHGDILKGADQNTARERKSNFLKKVTSETKINEMITSKEALTNDIVLGIQKIAKEFVNESENKGN